MNNNTIKDYVISLLEKGVRVDGRKLDDYRKPISIEMDVSKSAEGSARVKIGDTEVIAGVKLDVGEPFTDTPNEGVLIVGAELLALSSPDFQSGPPDAQTIEIARVVDRGIRNSGMIDTEKLCIKEGELVWMIFLDIYTINDDGNLIDASALAAVAALQGTVFPVIKDNKVVYGEHTKKPLPLKNTPISCTFGKIKDFIIIDPHSDEERVLDSRLTVSVSEGGNIHALQKGGEGVVSAEDIDKILKIAVLKSKDLRNLL